MGQEGSDHVKLWLKLSENRRSSVKNQFAHYDSALKADEKWSKNHHDDDLSYPAGVIASQKSKSANIRICMNFKLQ